MKKSHVTGGLQMIRLAGIFTSIAIFVMVGCGNQGGGCSATGNGNDPDGDGVEQSDNCPDVANTDQADSDDDGVGDACDNCPLAVNVDQGDRDDDGVGDLCDNSPDEPNPEQGDSDSDGVGNASDNCPDVANPLQEDGDQDDHGDVCDNCPADANADQADVNGNGEGDACEGDGDGDGANDADDNCLTISNPDQNDEDLDGRGDACDNCVNDANSDQADEDNDDFGDACDNCPNTVGNVCTADDDDGDGVPDGEDNCPTLSNPTQADDDEDGTGDACDNCPTDPTPDCSGGGGSTSVPVVVNAGSDQAVCSGSVVTLDATSTPAQPTATLRWSQLPGGPATGVNNAADPANFVAPASSSGVSQVMTFRATGNATGFDPGSDTTIVQTRPLNTNAILTKSSGAAQPGDSVSLDLADEQIPAVSIVWVQDAADTVRVVLSQPNGGNTEATFTAPTISTTIDLHFVAVGACTNGASGIVDAGKQTVSIQKAEVAIDLPVSINVGDTLALIPLTTTNAPADAELLYFASSPGSSDDLPAGTTVTVDQDAGTLTINGAPDGTVIEITVQLFGTAGLLDTASDTIIINAN